MSPTPEEDGRMRKAVGVYDRPPGADGHRKLLITILVVALALAAAVLFFFPRVAHSADDSWADERSAATRWSQGPVYVIPEYAETESGFASMYAADLEHRLTASGMPYDSMLLTAAHRTLPFGTRVRVTDEASGRSVVVTVNDRWGGTPGWVINLSRGAAQMLGITPNMRRSVRLEVEALGDGKRFAVERAEGIAPPVLPSRIEDEGALMPVSAGSDASLRRCENEADILGLREPFRENHLVNCMRRLGVTRLGAR
jgi:hypothetical protein